MLMQETRCITGTNIIYLIYIHVFVHTVPNVTL